jgi:hypothetical protein
MNEQMIGNAEQLRERLGASDQYEPLRRRIAELEEENRQLKAGEYKAEQIARSIDAEVCNLNNGDFPNAVVAERLLALPADTLVEHAGLRAWFESLLVHEGLDLSKVPDDETGPLTALARVLDLA